MKEIDMPPRMPRIGSGWILPVAAVVVATVLSLLASHQEGISGTLYREVAVWALVLGLLGVGIVAAGAHFIDRHDPPSHPTDPAVMDPRVDH
jgi:hypothetical protein